VGRIIDRWGEISDRWGGRSDRWVELVIGGTEEVIDRWKK
jgi:hypothetical protein